VPAALLAETPVRAQGKPQVRAVDSLLHAHRLPEPLVDLAARTATPRPVVPEPEETPLCPGATSRLPCLPARPSSLPCTSVSARGWTRRPRSSPCAPPSRPPISSGPPWDVVDLLGARLDRIPDRRQPHYTPSQRFRILQIRSLLGWSREVAARAFRICPNTLSNWEKHADPCSETVGSTVRPTPPITRLADVVRSQTMLRLGFGGEDLVAQALARAGWKVSARSIRRIGRARGQPERPPPDVETGPRSRHPVAAHFTHHVWMMDVSVVQALLGGEHYLAAVFDAFSRAPLALATYERKPGAAAMARLLKAAVRAFGAPKYLITDRGGEFTGSVFRRTIARSGVVQRFGSTHNLFATARLERFHPPLTIGDLERRLEPALTHYLCLRPHQGLRGATPAEAFLQLPPAHARAVSPPRARPREGPPSGPFAIEFLDPKERRFPFLRTA